MILEGFIVLCYTDIGGRTKPIITGYRPSFMLNPEHYLVFNDATIHIEDISLQPGEFCEGTVQPLHSEYWSDVVVENKIHFFEGAREVGWFQVHSIEAGR